jgi:uncharacterized protein
MPRAGANHHQHPRMNVERGLVQLDLGPGLALQEVIGLGQGLVVVGPGLGRNFREMNGAWMVGHVGQTTPSGPAGTGDAWHGGKIDDGIIDVDYDSIPSADAKAFNLTITDLSTNTVENFPNVTMDAAKTNYVVAVVNDDGNGSEMVSVAVPNAAAGRPVQTGTIGGDINLADIKNDKDYSIKITSDGPAGTITDVPVAFINKDDPTPGSVLGLCRLFERRVNLAIQNKVSGGIVRCVPSASGKGIRVLASFPQALDARISLAAGTPNSALSALKLSNANQNVSHYWLGKGRSALGQKAGEAGDDGATLPKTADLIGSEAAFPGIYALDKIDLFNILCIPDATRAKSGDPTKLYPNVDPNAIFGAAMAFCNKRRAFLLIDPPPEIDDVDSAVDWKSSQLTVRDKNGGAYFPRVRLSDPLNEFQPRTFAPCGVVAGARLSFDSSTA